MNRKNKALQLGQFLALVASLLIAGQLGYILYKGDSFCLNGGCRVVEQLTKVSPLYFNLAGLLFFQVIFWGLRSSRNETRLVPSFVKTLLLTGLAVEAVLVSFQHLIAQAFCAYCLSILAFVVILNLLVGFRQAIGGVAVFAAVALAFASLELSQPRAGQQAFTAGVFASRPGQATHPENYLFFSSTCPHCEKVIAALKTNDRATVHFNPIDKVKSVDLPKTTINATYSPSVNKALLASLGIGEIPVLMTRTPDGWSIRRGDTAILAYLGSLAHPSAPDPSASPAATSSPSDVPGLPPQDGCQVSSGCTDAAGVPPAQPAR